MHFANSIQCDVIPHKTKMSTSRKPIFSHVYFPTSRFLEKRYFDNIHCHPQVSCRDRDKHARNLVEARPGKWPVGAGPIGAAISPAGACLTDMCWHAPIGPGCWHGIYWFPFTQEMALPLPMCQSQCQSCITCCHCCCCMEVQGDPATR